MSFHKNIAVLSLIALFLSSSIPVAQRSVAHAHRDLSQARAMDRQVASTALYSVTFEATWSDQTHPHPNGNFPADPHFSGLVGGLHNSSVSFWSTGQLASDGIEQMAERGEKSSLLTEVNAAISAGSADQSLSGGGIATSPGSVAITSFTVKQEFPLITLVSMLAPSPDWFVGISGLSLLDSNGEWEENIVIPLVPYDAGTDSGQDYTSSNADTVPAEPISNLTGQFPFSNQMVGTFTITRVDLPPTPTPTPVPSGCGPLAQEAEAGELSGAWFVGNDGNASGGQYISIPDNDSVANAAAINNNSAAYCFTVTTAGTYRIVGGMYAADGRDNSVFLTVNGQPTDGYNWGFPVNTTYDLDYANDRNGADPIEVFLDVGEHSIVLNSREDGVRIDTLALELVGSMPPTPTPIPPTPTPLPTGCGPLTQEAEAGELSGAWFVGNDGNASGGQYISIPDNDSVANAAAINNNSAAYCFTVTTAGTYRIVGGMYAADGRDNSVFLTVNGQPIDGYDWGFPVNTTYDLDYANDRNGADPIEVFLEVGEHSIVLNSREDGVRIDTLALELVGGSPPTPTPTPLPTGCGPLTQEAEDGQLFNKFVIGNDANASGGQFVHVPDSGSLVVANAATIQAANINTDRRVDYCVTIPESGDYRIRTQVLAPDNRGNSFFVQVDGLPTSGYLYDIFPATGNYITDYVSDRGGADPLVFNLSAGDHIISFILREDGARLDSLTVEAISDATAASVRPSQLDIDEDLAAEGALPSERTTILIPWVVQSQSK